MACGRLFNFQYFYNHKMKRQLSRCTTTVVLIYSLLISQRTTGRQNVLSSSFISIFLLASLVPHIVAQPPYPLDCMAQKTEIYCTDASQVSDCHDKTNIFTDGSKALLCIEVQTYCDCATGAVKTTTTPPSTTTVTSAVPNICLKYLCTKDCRRDFPAEESQCRNAQDTICTCSPVKKDPKGGGGSSMTWAFVALGIVAAVLVCLILVFFLKRWNRKKEGTVVPAPEPIYPPPAPGSEVPPPGPVFELAPIEASILNEVEPPPAHHHHRKKK